MQPQDQMEGARLTEYTPESIKAITEVLAPQSTNYANAITEQIGQAQQSMGPYSAAAMGNSRTAGIGNYTYNRLVRPTVDTLRDEILVEGYKDSLNALLTDALRAAKKNYEGSGGSGTTEKSGWDGKTTKSSGGDTSDFWKKGTIRDDVAYYGLYKLDRPKNMSDEDWYDYASKWINQQAMQHGEKEE